MAATYLVVRTIDVTQTAIRVATVTVSFNGGPPVALSQVADGIVEVTIPPRTTKVGVTATPAAPYWPASQDAIVDLSSSPPSIRFDGGQQFNTSLVRVVTRGADFNLELHFVIGQLVDATASTGAVAAGAGISYDTPVRQIRRFSTPLLNPSGTAERLLNASPANVTFRGSIFFAARQTTPKLVAFGHPGWNAPRDPHQARLPIPFHVFYHPSIPWNDAYPNGPNYLGLVARYLCKTLADGGKAMLYQNNADTLKNVLVFPIGSQLDWMGDAGNAAGVYRLLQEAAFYVQRMQGIALPMQPVGSITVSCFSAGVRPMASVVTGGGPRGFQQALRNIFVFDGVFAGAAGDQETTTFCNVLGPWLRRGGARSLRVYTQSGLWLDRLQPLIGSPIAVRGGAGSREIDGSTCTALHVPTAFWGSIAPGLGYWEAHQLIPSLFMEHAVTNSSFQ